MGDVTTKHAEYEANELVWKRLRDCLAGEDAIKGRDRERLPASHPLRTGEASLTEQPVWRSQDLYGWSKMYLPPLPGHRRSIDYANYQRRAKFYGATGRTLEGLVGAVFRKPLTVEPDPDTEPFATWLPNIDLAGSSLDTFARRVLRAVLGLGRAGIMVDYSTDPVPVAERRPYFVTYPAERIFNWRTENRGGQQVLTRVVLYDPIEEDDEDGWGVETINRVRVLRLENGVFRSDIFQQEDGATDWVMTESVLPERRGALLDFIPFIFAGPDDTDPCVARSPILALANVNLHHYVVGADYYQGLFKTSLPQPWTQGDDDKIEYVWGGGVWRLPPGATANMLEYTGAGVGSVREALEDDKAEMAMLGARMLQQQKRAAETAETVRLQQAGEQSIVATAAQTVSTALTQALKWAVDWAGGDSSAVRVYLNTELGPHRTADDLTKLFAILQGGGMAMETWLSVLLEEEYIESVEAELERLATQGPLGLGGGGGNANDLLTVLDKLSTAIDKLGGGGTTTPDTEDAADAQQGMNGNAAS